VARSWVQQDHEVTVYCRTREPGQPREWFTEGVRCVWTPGRDTKSTSTLSFGLTSHLDASFRDLDVALVLNVANGFFLPVLRAAGIPVALNTDGLEWQRGKWGRIAQAVFYEGAKMSARHADVLISDSQVIADIWGEEFDVASRFIPYGADIRENVGSDRVTSLGLKPGNYILTVARIIPENNVELLLDALETTPDIQGVIVGSANYATPTEARLRAMEGAGRIRWLGHIDDQELLVELWANAAVYVHGHSVGGTNPALLQALGAGAPTLALDTPFNREVVVNDDQLFPLDAIELSRRILTVVDDRSLQARWRVRGKEVIRARYCWASVTDAYELALRDAIARGMTCSQSAR
jgi:glycosyltransferase involved in cell wall biosynthesis